MPTDRDPDTATGEGAAPAAEQTDLTTQPAPDAGIPADSADVTDAPSDHTDVEQSPAFQGLVSLRTKLIAHANGSDAERERIQKQLSEDVIPQITDLERQLAEKRQLIEKLLEQQQKLRGAKDALGVIAADLLYSGDDLKRTKVEKTDIARKICAELFGRDDVLPLLLEGKPCPLEISGLSLKISELEQRVAKLQQKLDEVKAKLPEARLRTSDTEYQTAHAEWESAIKELATARIRENALSTELQHLLELIHVIDETIKKLSGQPDAFQVQVRQISIEGHTAADNLQKARNDENNLQSQLDTKRQNETHSRGLLTEYQDDISTTNGLVEKFGEAMEILKRAVYTTECTPNLITGLGKVFPVLKERTADALGSIDESIIQIGDTLYCNVVSALGYMDCKIDSNASELEKAQNQLDALLKKLQDSVATANSAEGSSLNWQAIDEIVGAATSLKELLDKDWPKLNAGSEAKIAEIQQACIAELEHVMGRELGIVGEAQKRIRALRYPPKNLTEVDFVNIEYYPTDDLCRYLEQAEAAKDDIRFGLVAAELAKRPLEDPKRAQAYLTVARAFAAEGEKDASAKDWAIKLFRAIRDLQGVAPETQAAANQMLKTLIPPTHTPIEPEALEHEGMTLEEAAAYVAALRGAHQKAPAAPTATPITAAAESAAAPPVEPPAAAPAPTAYAATHHAAPAEPPAPAALLAFQEKMITVLVQDARNAETARDWDIAITITTNLITHGIQNPQIDAEVNLILANALFQTGDIQNLHKAAAACDYVCQLRGILPVYVGQAVRLRGEISAKMLDATTIIRPAPTTPMGEAVPAASAAAPAAPAVAAARSRLSRISVGSIEDENE